MLRKAADRKFVRTIGENIFTESIFKIYRLFPGLNSFKIHVMQ